ncbi:hypothetical protein [Catenulispora yoronensis]|uniref:hypothetical protein n=1 Tax=Catenulispora yoronensis TaxID=450799 RepID=UPI0031D65B78
MSSSGLIYAGIVGAWAVYLVPVWLRREEQLNEAREKARYAAAIRTLGRSERFEKKVLAEEALAATGTDGAPPPRAGDDRSGTQTPAPAPIATPAKRPRKAAPGATPAVTAAQSTAQNNPQDTPQSSEDRDGRSATPSLPKAKPSPAAQARTTVTAHLPHHHSRPTAKPSPAATAARRRNVLLMRRRRVVAFLFTLATFGALVSAVMGLSYSWAMAAPAALFSGYIVYIRRDEKQRTRERYRRRQAVLAAERRRDRERQRQDRTPAGPRVPAAPEAVPAVTEPDGSVWRPVAAPQEYRRAANG